MELKEEILLRYRQLVQDKIDVFRDMISGLADDAQNDAKGSAGDKHETALSMMHLEQEKLTQKLRENLDMKAVLDKLEPHPTTKIALGSLVKANNTYLYLCAALPKITVDGKSIIALSPQSPLGQQLLGQSPGFCFQIMGTEYVVEAVS
ncbi:Transcription elongation factor [Flavobacterium longum]|uniref:hypothetical protein n=1 Tax=Flavobacterium longum TaxID=1299340 RepID=UPI0039EBEAC1